MFKDFSETVYANLKAISNQELFIVDTTDLFASYLLAFPEGTNLIFRTRTEHDCSCCRNFIKNMGGVIAIVDGKRKTIWECSGLPHPYDAVALSMHNIIMQRPISGVFRTNEHNYGAEKTVEIKDGNTLVWDHFHGDVNPRHVTKTPDKDRGIIGSTADVLRRGLTEFKLETIDTVIDLINSNSLYRGGEFLESVKEFRRLMEDYKIIPDAEICVWSNVGSRAARFRNTSIGSLVQDLSDNVPLEDAVRMFESKVAPENYKRSTAIITSKMVDAALKTLSDIGLETAIYRRFANISDIGVNDVLFVDNSVRDKMKPAGDLRTMLISGIVAKPEITKTTAISINDFVGSVLPTARKVEVMVKNNHLGNFVSLTAPTEVCDGRLFKWKNDFGWSYDGEVTDSIKQRVKKAGGNVQADLRISLAWSNHDDLDLHAQCPDGHLSYMNKKGILDVDMNAGRGQTRSPVENLSWAKPRDGLYQIYVNQFQKRETQDVGFQIEMEINGRLSQFSYGPAVSGSVECFSFRMVKGVVQDFKINNNKIVGGDISTAKWGVKTETFVPASIIMNSPNHWFDSGGVGHKHWFFMLDGCINPDPVRGIYNEFLRGDLTEHRKVFEVLGSKTKCQPTATQLSGLGFSSGRNDEVVVRITASSGTSRDYAINF